ncbi:MAG: HlyD family type I secretion periplasmic adaptor subunit [Akkermansia sp.]|nr:HlyD family type I secretion periplasmic adaptor subunit [Akkermansia sp.]
MSKKRRKLKELTDADIAACEPESIWLETRKCPVPAHSVLWVLVILLVLTVVWACVSKVDKVVAAEGKLVTCRPNITMKPLERTVIKSVPVRVGQVVDKDQILVELDPTVNQAELRSLCDQLAHYRCQAVRLRAEQSSAQELVFPEDLTRTEAASLQRALFLSRLEYFTKRVQYLNASVERYEATSASVDKSLAKYDEMMEPLNRIEEVYVNLAEKGMAPRVEMLQTKIQRMGNEIEVENQRTRLVEDEQMRNTAAAELDTFVAEWKQQINEQLADTELQIVALREKVRQTEYLASTESLKAPCRAVVHEIAPYQEGSAVREAEAFITLIPLDEPLEAEVDVLPKDVGLLRKGDKAKLKLDAFPFQKYGTLQGTISFISADTYESVSNLDQEESAGLSATGGKRPQYRVRMAVSGDLDGVPKELWQSAGMRLRAEIIVGERTVLSYLMHPFLKAMDESIREP